MKNIHILQTNKPTGIFKSGDNLLFSITNKVRTNPEGFHIYITFNEEIKIGDYGYDQVHNCVVRITENLLGNYLYKKIILTTDVDLIKDGVQAINDEFLEWFIQNPTCEEVVVTYGVLNPFQSEEQGYLIHCSDNEVLEEPKQLTDLEIAIKLEEIESEPKERTIEEAAGNTHNKEYIKQIFFEAIKVTGEGWNGEYAEGNNPIIEEVFNEEFENWFNRFKNK